MGALMPLGLQSLLSSSLGIQGPGFAHLQSPATVSRWGGDGGRSGKKNREDLRGKGHQIGFRRFAGQPSRKNKDILQKVHLRMRP